MTKFIGIDPGKHGGLCWVDGRNAYAIPMPGTDRGILDWLEANSDAGLAVIEKVGGYVKGKYLPGSSMFNFGVNYGLLRMALTAMRIPFEEVAPRSWQKGLGIQPRGSTESGTDWKNRLKQKAQQLYPSCKITLMTADAILIAEYCRRRRQSA